MVCALVLLASGQAFAATITSNGSGNWDTVGTWSAVPGSGDDVIIATNHTVTVDANVSIKSVTTQAGATLNFAVNATPFTLSAGAGGIQNSGTFDATNAGAITSAATLSTAAVLNSGTFTMGSGTLNATAGIGINNNSGTFTGGSGLITTFNFRNNTASFTVGSGGMTLTGSYNPLGGTILLNGNVTIATNIFKGTATVSGTGKMILTDAVHTIGIGAAATIVNVHNLEIVPLTAPRTITISTAVTATGTTKLNGSAAGTITFAGLGTFSSATTAYYCATSAIANITCNPLAPPAPPPPISASINLMSNEKPVIFTEEIEMK